MQSGHTAISLDTATYIYGTYTYGTNGKGVNGIRCSTEIVVMVMRLIQAVPDKIHELRWSTTVQQVCVHLRLCKN